MVFAAENGLPVCGLLCWQTSCSLSWFPEDKPNDPGVAFYELVVDFELASGTSLPTCLGKNQFCFMQSMGCQLMFRKLRTKPALFVLRAIAKQAGWNIHSSDAIVVLRPLGIQKLLSGIRCRPRDNPGRSFVEGFKLFIFLSMSF